VQANPDIAKQVASAGNEVASHTVSHPNLTSVGAERLNRELAGNAEILEKVYGRKPLLMRPPYGSHNKTVDEAVRTTGAAIIQWDVDTNDWKTKSKSSTENAVVYGGGATANSIVLMHDIHPSTVAAAPAILEGLQQKNVTLVTTSELSLNSDGFQAGRAYCNGTAKAEQDGFNCSG
jgi:peptidoglycan-N-acetylglucosamine deacetylase